MENLELWELVREVPATAKKPIEAGRLKGKTDINPIWRLKTLTEQFGPCGIGWTYTVTKREFVPGNGGEIAVFVDIDLTYKTADGWSEPVHGIGGSMFVVKESKGLYTDDEAPKKAETDAISVAAKSLGIAADVYWDKDVTKYTPRPEQKPSKAEPAKAPEPPKVTEEHLIGLRAICTPEKLSKICSQMGVKQLEDLPDDRVVDYINRYLDKEAAAK